MRALSLAFILMAVAHPLFAEDAKVTAEKLRPLQGKWAAHSFESKNGKQEGNGIVMEFIGDTMYCRSPNGERPAQVVAVDTTAVPSRIDVRFNRDIGIITSQAIFKIEGEMLTICSYDGNGNNRPREFVASKDRVHLAVYKRLSK